jgi:hypothetical protein
LLQASPFLKRNRWLNGGSRLTKSDLVLPSGVNKRGNGKSPMNGHLNGKYHLLIDEVLSIARFVCRKVRQNMTKFMDWHSSFNL